MVTFMLVTLGTEEYKYFLVNNYVTAYLMHATFLRQLYTLIINTSVTHRAK